MPAMVIWIQRKLAADAKASTGKRSATRISADGNARRNSPSSGVAIRSTLAIRPRSSSAYAGASG